MFETTGRERKKLWCDRLNKIILDSLNISPEQRSKILENLRLQRNLTKQQQQQQKAQKKRSGLDSLKKATNILHRNRRTSMDSHRLAVTSKEAKPSHKGASRQQSSPDLVQSAHPQETKLDRGNELTNGQTRARKAKEQQHEHRSISKSWAVLQDSPMLQQRFKRNRSGQKRYHSQFELRDLTEAAKEAKKSLATVPLQRSVSEPRWMDSIGAMKKDSARLRRGPLDEVPRSRQWRQMLFTLGSRLRTSLMSSDSACSSGTQSLTGHRGGSVRPASMDSALFYGANSEESDGDVGPDDEEIESNNSSGSFYERIFELSCRDEIFRDSAVFSEDAISQLSTDLSALRTAGPNASLDLGCIERTESGFAEEVEEVDQKTLNERK